MMKVFPVINYSLFYETNNLPKDVLKKVLTYNLENVILFLIAARNCFRVRGRKGLDFKLVQTFVASLPTAKAERLLTLLNDENAEFHLITNVVINKLLLDLSGFLSTAPGQDSLNDPKFSEDILDVILVYNEIHYTSKNVSLEPDTPELIWKIMLMQDVNATDEVNFARTSAPKHIIFLRFLRILFKDELKGLNTYLQEKHGIPDIREFFVTIINVYVQLTNALNNGHSLIKIGPSEPAYDLLHGLKMVIDRETISNRNFDIGTLITKPFFKATDENLYLVDSRDFAFLTEKAWIYSLFSSGAISSVRPEISGLNNYLSFIGKEYYEKYLLSTLLKSLESSGIRVLPSDDQYLPDLSIIVNEKDVFLIEVKSASINYRSIDDQKVHEFKDFIDKQFAIEKKGVSQLVKNISYLTDDKYSLFGIRNKVEKLTVIPIIIFVEYHLDIPAVNTYVNEKFTEALNVIDKPFKELLPLTMIHYDFFIENIRLLKKDRSLLKRLIREYWRNSKKKISEYEKFKSTLNYMKSQISFDRYVIGKEGVYRVDQKDIFSDMADVFCLREGIG